MRRIALLSLAMLALGAGAQVYKWVDEKGVSHYSEIPPPDGRAAKIDVKPSTGSAPSAPSADWRQREMDARALRIEKQQKEQEREAQDKTEASTRRNNCRESRRRLADLQTAVPVYELNDKDERVYLEDAQREREITVLQAQVKQYCD
jgi:hypothetical protein